MDYPDPEDVTAIIEEVARKEVMPRFGKLKDDEVWKKPSGGTVTTADLASEEELRTALTALLPGSMTLGEEECDADLSILERLKGREPVWVIDPVDGTSNFARGDERFAILVALWHDSAIQAGWICAPAMKRTLQAVRGQGAWEGKERLAIGTAANRREKAFRGSLGGRLRRVEGMEDNFGEVINLKCCGIEYLEIASGTLDFAHYRQLRPWDHCAGTLIIEEAGGHVASLGPNPYDPVNPASDGLLIAASSEIHAHVEGAIAPALKSFEA